MEISLLIALIIVALIAALAFSPRARRNRDASEAETRATARSGDRVKQFKRRLNRRGLR
jgi:type II secretory pathway component PulJ